MAYLVDIRKRTTKSISDTMAGGLTHLQDNYGQLIPHKLLEREDIVKKTIYNLRNPITTAFSAVEEILKFDDITGTLYMQLQVVNIVYFILHKTCKFGMAICKWNPIPSIQKTWLRFKQIFRTYH